MVSKNKGRKEGTEKREGEEKRGCVGKRGKEREMKKREKWKEGSCCILRKKEKIVRSQV